MFALSKKSILFSAVLLACGTLSAQAADTPAELAQIFKNVPKLNPKAALATTRVHYIAIPFVPILASQMPNPQSGEPAAGIAATVAMQNTPATKVQTNTASSAASTPSAPASCTGSPPNYSFMEQVYYNGVPQNECLEQTYNCSNGTWTRGSMTTEPASDCECQGSAPNSYSLDGNICIEQTYECISAQWTKGLTYPVSSSYCGVSAATTPTSTTTTNTAQASTCTQTATPSCSPGEVQTSAPTWNTSTCQWVQSCAQPTFANTATATKGPETTCSAGYTLNNGYCVANNAYVAANQPQIGIGYVALDMTNAVYNSTDPTGQQWTGTVGFEYGDGVGAQEVQIPASLFTGNPGYSLNGLPTVLESYTASNGLTIYVVGGTSIPLATQTYSAPVCPTVNGGSDCAAGEVPGGTGVGKPILNGIMLYIPALGNMEIPIYGEVYDSSSTGYLYGGGTSYASNLMNLGITNTQFSLVNVVDTGSNSTTLYNLGNGQTMTMAQACTANGVFQGDQGVTYTIGAPGQNTTYVGGNGCNAIAGIGVGPLPGPYGQATNIYAAAYASLLYALDGGGTPTSNNIAKATNIMSQSGAGDQPTGSGGTGSAK